MTWLSEILLTGANIGMAAYHASLFKKGKTVQHGWWGAGYLALAGVLAWYHHSILFFFAALLIRKIVFDLSLNLFNGRPLFFVSTETTSIIDKLHYKLFGKKSEVYMSIYFVVTIVLNLLM